MGVASCNRNNDPDKPDTPNYDPELKNLTETSINGTAIQSGNDLAGVIKNAKTGKGIAGVAVTDGYNFVKTDANGVYQMKRDDRCRKVYYTTPAEYEIYLDTKYHMPCFFSPKTMEKGFKYRVDFTLTPLPAPEKDFSIIMIGDPQCYQTSEVVRYTKETIADIKATVPTLTNKSVYAMTLGDITFDSTNLWSQMRASMANVEVNGRYLPFFQCIGNHDHNSLEADSKNPEDNDYRATGKFFEFCGPTDYSFDRGDTHIIVMDDIPVQSLASSSKPNNHTWNYYAGYTDTQWNWFKQDIENVADKANKMVFVCMHIPVRGGGNNSGSSFNTSRHYADLLNALKQFKEAHIMIGHTHYPQNYVHTSQKALGGLPIYEHIHQAACGAWWANNSSVTGGPNGYNIYDVKGASVVDWINKGTNRPKDYQIRVYDGNQIYNGKKGYAYSWYNTKNVGAGITAKGNVNTKNCFVVEAWDDDDTYCSVEFWQDGAKKGNFQRIPNGGCTNIALCGYWYNEGGKTTDTYVSTTASHYWYFPAPSGEPKNEKNWEVKFIRKIPASGKENVYSRKDLTTDYSEF